MKSISYKILASLFLLLIAAGAHAQLITTVAGTGIAGAGSSGGPATKAELAGPVGIGIDPSNGDVYIADSANNLIHKVDHITGIITTVAGGGLTGLGDGGPATFGMLSGPTGVCVDAFHNLYIADFGNNRIRKVIYSSGVITTIVNSSGAPSYSGDGGSALLATIFHPYGVRIDGTGNLFIADRDNSVIREVSGGTISTVAGFAAGFGKDGGPATSAEMDQPVGVAVDMYNNIYIADQANNVVRMVSSSTGLISTIAGNGLKLGSYTGDGGPATAATLNAPTGLVYDNTGSELYIADMGNNCIRKISPLGVMSTVVNKVTVGAPLPGWSADGTVATAAKLNQPTGVYLTGSGASLVLYIADAGNNTVRAVTVGSTKLISTVAGNHLSPGYGGDGGSATAASLNLPSSVTVDGSKNVYIADANNNRIREVLTTGGIATTAMVSGGVGYAVGDLFAIPGGTGQGQVLTVGGGGVVTSYVITVPGAGYNPGTVTVTPITGIGVNLKITIVSINPTIVTFAGDGTGAGALNGDGNPATAARVNHPTGLVYDPFKNVIYISEHDSDNIRMVPILVPVISTVAGLNAGAYAGDGALAVNAKINHPYSVAVDAFGNVYIGDADNERIRKIYFDPGSGPLLDRIYTVAGNAWGDIGYGGLASYIDMLHPSGVALNSGGEMFIADQGNHVVRKVDVHGVLHVVAGTGVAGYLGDGGNATDAQLDLPYAVAYDNTHGILYIADAQNNAIRKVVIGTGIITTIAGTGAGGYVGDGVAASTTKIWSPSGIDVNQASGDLFIADRANNRVRKVAYTTNIITTFAGTGVFGYLADGGPATAAELNGPYATAVDTFGNIYIADRNNNIVRKVNQLTGAITTIAGNGSAGYAGDGAAASLATLDGPNGITIDPTYKILYISDAGNNVIRKIDLTTNLISLFAGNPTPITGVGYVNGAALGAKFYYPTGLCTDNTGNVYVADGNNNAIRKITLAGLTVSTVAGMGPYAMGCSGDGGAAVSAELDAPTGVCFNKAATTMYIADFGNGTIRAVDVASGKISTFAGTAPTAPACTPVYGFSGDGGPAISAELNQPTDVATDKSGNVFISDFGNNRIRVVNGAGIIKTVAGKGTPGYSGDGGAAQKAELNTPFGVSVDTGGNYYIADKGNNVIRKVTTVLLASYATSGNGVCQDSCITFYNTSIGNTDSLRWSTTAPAAIIASPTSDTTTICFNTAGAYTVTLNIYYQGKNNSSVQPVTISATPTPVIGQSGFILSVPSAYAAYQWSVGGTAISGANSAIYTYTANGTYTVTVDSNGCPGTSGPITVTIPKPTLGNHQLAGTSGYRYWLSRNAQDVNTITLHASQQLSDDLNIGMFDATGREILDDKWKQGSNSIEVNGPTLPPGLYIIRLTNSTTSSVLRWQKE